MFLLWPVMMYAFDSSVSRIGCKSGLTTLDFAAEDDWMSSMESARWQTGWGRGKVWMFPGSRLEQGMVGGASVEGKSLQVVEVVTWTVVCSHPDVVREVGYKE